MPFCAISLGVGQEVVTDLSSASAFPNVFFALRGEHALLVPVDRQQRRRAGREQRVVLLGGAGQVIRCDQHHLMVLFGFGHSHGEVLDRLPQRRQLGAIVEQDGLLEAGRPTLKFQDEN
jgi:hypothetical protein